MLHKIEQDGGSEHPIHLIFGVTNDPDLVKVDELEGYAERMPNFTFTCVVAAEESSYPNKGYVTHHMKPEHLNDGLVDIYLCGPPPMVDAVRKYLADQGIAAGELLLREVLRLRRGQRDRRVARQGRRLGRGVRHPDGAGAGRGPARGGQALGRAARRVPAAGGGDRASTSRTATSPTRRASGRPTRPSTCSRSRPPGTPTLVEAYRKLLVQEYMGQVLTPSVDLVGDITQDHIDIVDAFEKRRLRGPAADHRRAQRPRQGDHAGRDREAGERGLR